MAVTPFAVALAVCVLTTFVSPHVASADIPAPLPPATEAIITGHITSATAGTAVSGAIVRLGPAGVTRTTGPDGAYMFEGLAPGRYDLVVSAEGFASVTQTVVVTMASHVIDVALMVAPTFSESVSVSTEMRSPFEAYQPISRLEGQDLDLQREGTLGAALRNVTGVTERTSGPGPSRPVIRGFDGDRVLILEDSQSTGDLSSQSADHGVNINPAMAARIEVVRGPATLLYGANAIGGLVNVITNAIPTGRVTAPVGRVTMNAASASREAGVAGDIGLGRGGLAVRMAGSARRSDDLGTPMGRVANTASRAEFGNVGVSWIGGRSLAGVSYGFDRSRYGLPAAFVSDPVTLDPTRHGLTARVETRDRGGWFPTLRASGAFRRYTHNEIEGGEIGTVFDNTTADVNLLAVHRPLGRLSGTVGIEASGRRFSATGEEALTSPTRQRALSFFAVEEVAWPRITFQAGTRVEHTTYQPEDPSRSARQFTSVSLSSGVVARPRRDMTLAVNVSRSERRPALEELYFQGLHIGNFAFETGNDALRPEVSTGVDAAVRWQGTRTHGEIAVFHNAIGRFIYRRPTGDFFEGFPIYIFSAADSVHRGVELRGAVDAGGGFWLEGAFDATRASLDDGAPLPRIPAKRGTLTGRWRLGAMQTGAELIVVAAQARTAAFEEPTAGYRLLNLLWARSIAHGPSMSTITVSLNNVGNVLYRNHLSFIKAFVPERGRNLQVSYTVDFGQ